VAGRRGPLEPAAGRSEPLSARRLGYARWTVRTRWWIVGGWALFLAGLSAVAPRLGGGGDDLTALIPPDSPAIAAEVRSVEHFGFPLSSRTVVVQRDTGGLSPFVEAESVLDAVSINQAPQRPPLIGALPVSNSLPLGGAAAESGTTVLTYLFTDPTSTFSAQLRAADRYVAEHLDRPEDRVVGVAGSVPARAEQARLVSENLSRLELLTVLAILLLVGVTFRSVLVPVLALVASGLAFLLTVRLSQVLGALLGLGAPAELEPLLVALLLGVVTDYTVFYTSALKGRLQAGVRWDDAVVEAVGQ